MAVVMLGIGKQVVLASIQELCSGGIDGAFCRNHSFGRPVLHDVGGRSIVFAL